MAETVDDRDKLFSNDTISIQEMIKEYPAISLCDMVINI